MEILIERLKKNIAELEGIGDRIRDWERGRLSAFRGVLKQLEELNQ